MSKPDVKIREYSLDEIENLMDRHGIIHVNKAIALLDKLKREKPKKTFPMFRKHTSYSRK